MIVEAGARIGAISGFFCAGMADVFATLRIAILHQSGEIRAAILNALDQQAVKISDPRSQALFDFFRSPGGLLVMLVFSLIVGLIIFILLGMIGGALGGAGLSRRDGK